jgi:anti-anti-sigma factor
LTVTFERPVDAVVVIIAGELDMLTSPQMSWAIAQALRERRPVLVVDLSKVDFLDCAGMDALLTAHERVLEHTLMRVVANTRMTLKPMRLIGIDEKLALYASREEALARLTIVPSA